jgi:hypothetical protein
MKLDDLLKISEIRRKLSSSSEESYYLRMAMRNYVVLLDDSLSNSQKAEKLGICYNNVNRQLRTLRNNKLTDTEEVKRYVEKLRL